MFECLDMTAWFIAVGVAAGVAAHGMAWAQSTAGRGSPPFGGSIALVDSTGKVAARALTDTMVLIAVGTDVAAPASIGPIYGADGRTASGLATWQSGGSVLFTSSDCTTGAHVYSLPHPGVRAATQVKTPAGIVLFVGAIGTTSTVGVHSILYDTGCSAVALQQNGVLPVVATVNLTTEYPPPLSFR